MLELLSTYPVKSQLIMRDLGLDNRFQFQRVYKKAQKISGGLVKRVGKNEYYLMNPRAVEEILEDERGR